MAHWIAASQKPGGTRSVSLWLQLQAKKLRSSGKSGCRRTGRRTGNQNNGVSILGWGRPGGMPSWPRGMPPLGRLGMPSRLKRVALFGGFSKPISLSGVSQQPDTWGQYLGWAPRKPTCFFAAIMHFARSDRGRRVSHNLSRICPLSVLKKAPSSDFERSFARAQLRVQLWRR